MLDQLSGTTGFYSEIRAMSVFSFSRTTEVWGLNRVITIDMIDWWIERVGPKPYLLKIKRSFDHGYNHGDLTNVSNEDKAELRDLIMLMLEENYESIWKEMYSASTIAESIIKLEQLINADLEGTRFHRMPDSK
ncbi:hypothetical protein RNI52_01705 [Labrys neptuniae]|uniref:hypothetical protein n=1 Tax=Labrys neptuniae TaxID=376174 RepID=UPI002890FDA2|nr:hypothetical protein [Labrys neptuniae]MDT3376027.1 hypothetical protein [Labrys neptuniae]